MFRRARFVAFIIVLASAAGEWTLRFSMCTPAAAVCRRTCSGVSEGSLDGGVAATAGEAPAPPATAAVDCVAAANAGDE